MAPISHYINFMLQSTNMKLSHIPTWLTAATAFGAVAQPPSLKVPKCPTRASISYDRSVPNLTDFPNTQVELCWTKDLIKIDFTAFEEKSFYFNKTQTTNDPIYQYEVMEAFVAPGTKDPSFYFEIEVAPSNVTFNAFISNPSKIREEGAQFETYYVEDPIAKGLRAWTTLDKEKRTWLSQVQVPQSLFDVSEEGYGKGQKWRMNFFRTVTTREEFPSQQYGAWSPPDAANFHKTPFFGRIEFV